MKTRKITEIATYRDAVSFKRELIAKPKVYHASIGSRALLAEVVNGLLQDGNGKIDVFHDGWAYYNFSFR